MTSLQTYVKDGLVILAYNKKGYLPMVIQAFTPDDADKLAATFHEMAEQARRQWTAVEELKAGVK